MSDVHVQKIWAAVRLSQPRRDPRDGWFQLFPSSPTLGRAETILDLLNSPRLAIPFLERDDNTIALLVRENIEWVAIGAGTDISLVVPPDRPAALEQRVLLDFLNEQRIEATIRWGDFVTVQRLSDFLGSEETFVAAEASFGTLIVNKRRLREIRIVNTDSADAPLHA